MMLIIVIYYNFGSKMGVKQMLNGCKVVAKIELFLQGINYMFKGNERPKI